MEYLGGEPPAWVQGTPCVVPYSYKPPSASAVLLIRGLKLGWLKLWPKTVEPLLLYTRGCSDNVIVMIFSEELIGYHLCWGHLSGRHLALFLVNTWVTTDDRRRSSLMSRVSAVDTKPLSTNEDWHTGFSQHVFWCLWLRDCYLMLTHIDADWTSAIIFMPHKCKFVFPETFLRKQWFAAKSPQT